MEEHEILMKKTVANGFIIMVHLPWNRVTPWATYKASFEDITKIESGTYHRTEDAARVEFSNREW